MTVVITETNEAITFTTNNTEHSLVFRPKLDVKQFLSTYASHVHEDSLRKKYLAVGDELGTSVKNFVNMLNGALYRKFVTPNIQYVKRFAYVKGNLSPKMVNVIHQKAGALNEHDDADTKHVQAFVLLFGSLKNAKKECGRGLWKKLCKNSKTRNDMIVQKVVLEESSDKAKAVAFCNKWPSHFIKHQNILRLLTVIDDPKTIINAVSTPWYKLDSDTFDEMAFNVRYAKSLLGHKFNKAWSYKRILKERALELHRMELVTYSFNKFHNLEAMPDKVKLGQYTAYKLTCGRDLYYINHILKSWLHSLISECRNGRAVIYVILDQDYTASTFTRHFQHDYNKHVHLNHDNGTEYIDREVFSDILGKLLASYEQDEVDFQCAINCDNTAEEIPF
jgi:hypothetical protein